MKKNMNNKKVLIFAGVLIVIILLIILLIFLFKGGSKLSSNIQSFNIVNDELGYKVSFTYDVNDKYENYKEIKNENDVFANASIDNSELYLNFNIHYDTMPIDYYNSKITEGREYDYFKEFTTGKYDVFITSNDNFYAYGYILLASREENDTTMTDTIYFSINNVMDRENDEFYKALDDKRVEKLLSSIKLEKFKAKGREQNLENMEGNNE